MNSHQEHEVGFWIGHASQYGENYRAARIYEYEDKTQRFEPWWSRQEGTGLDIGCGCVSVLSDCGKHFYAIDPLVNEYIKISAAMLEPIYRCVSIEELPPSFTDESFDWLFCVNMLDHTPNPAIAVAQMYRILKPKGRLYFEVNFDDDAAPAHYGLWTLATVVEHFHSRQWFTRMFTVERHDAGNQWRYWGILEKL